MPATTSEAIANKARLRKERDRKASAAKRLTLKKSDLREYKNLGTADAGKVAAYVQGGIAGNAGYCGG